MTTSSSSFASSFSVAPVGDHEIRMARTIGAPRRAVYAAFTDPAQVKRWYGPSHWTLVSVDIDLRVGGKWRQVMERPDGAGTARMEMAGAYWEVNDGTRLVYTQTFVVNQKQLEMPDELVTLQLADVGDDTQLSWTTRYGTKEERDRVLGPETEQAARQSLDRLEQQLQQPRA